MLDIGLTGEGRPLVGSVAPLRVDGDLQPPTHIRDIKSDAAFLSYGCQPLDGVRALARSVLGTPDE